jgi:TPR repeat protein
LGLYPSATTPRDFAEEPDSDSEEKSKYGQPMRSFLTAMVLLLTCTAAMAQDTSSFTANSVAQYVAEAKKAEKRLDFNEGMSWYQKAADLGDPKSMYELGWIYFGSHDIPGRHVQDYAKAAIWFQKAADLNYAPAITQLGVMYGSPMDRRAFLKTMLRPHSST